MDDDIKELERMRKRAEKLYKELFENEVCLYGLTQILQKIENGMNYLERNL